MTMHGTAGTKTMTGLKGEPELSLPTRRLLTVMTLATIAAAGGLVAGSAAYQTSPTGPLVGALLAALTSFGAVLMMAPWRTRPVTSWMSWWLGGTVLRLLVTPVLAYLLYSATALDATPLALGVAVTYICILFTETGVLAAYLKRFC